MTDSTDYITNTEIVDMLEKHGAQAQIPVQRGDGYEVVSAYDLALDRLRRSEDVLWEFIVRETALHKAASMVHSRRDADVFWAKFLRGCSERRWERFEADPEGRYPFVGGSSWEELTKVVGGVDEG